MKRKRDRRTSWHIETREKVDLRQHAVGVLAALGYALLIILVGVVLAVAVSLLIPQRAGAQESGGELTTSTDMIQQAKQLDGETVIYEGEAIGEALERGDHAWVNVSDGKNAIGVWMPRADSDRIKRFGDYDNKGDLVRVTGEFNRADPEHGGDLDIRAAKVEILLEGTDRPHPVAAAKVIAAAVSLLLLAACGLLYWQRTIRKK